jgi:hypothetical protein
VTAGTSRRPSSSSTSRPVAESSGRLWSSSLALSTGGPPARGGCCLLRRCCPRALGADDPASAGVSWRQAGQGPEACGTCWSSVETVRSTRTGAHPQQIPTSTEDRTGSDVMSPSMVTTRTEGAITQRCPVRRCGCRSVPLGGGRRIHGDDALKAWCAGKSWCRRRRADH